MGLYRNTICMVGMFAFQTLLLLPPLTGQETAPAVERRYQVADILERMSRELGLNRAQSEARIVEHIKTVTSQAATPDNPGAQTQTHPLQAELQQGELVVSCGPERQLAIERDLETFRSFGFKQIVIRSWVFSCSRDEFASLPCRWQHVETASSIVNEPASPNVAPSPVVAAAASAGRFDNVQISPASFLATRRVTSSTDERLPSRDDAQQLVEAQSTIERSTPVVFTLLTPDEGKAALSAAQDLESSQLLMSPAVVVFNGQEARISNSVERPFVTDIKPVRMGTPGKETIQFAPKISIYPEGTTILMRPELTNGKDLTLSFYFENIAIREVEQFDMPRADMSNGRLSVQIPEVASNVFRSKLPLPVDHTLAVTTFDEDQDGEKRCLVAFARCSVKDVGTTEQP